MSPTVAEFYAGKTVFITGGTGFVGKVLVEKLLRSCPDVKTICLLMRPKKGYSCEERLHDLCSSKVFDLVKRDNPGAFKKLKFIDGDITVDGLGISDEDNEMLRDECNIIFHSAACVRFDQKLKEAVNMNTTGTLRLLTLAETMNKLQAFIHLSTAFCRCELDVLEEKLYKAVHSPRRIMDIVDWMDNDTLDYLEPKLISSEPNTYSYTKAITEDLVAEYGNKFPLAIARPSIVTPAWKEPFPGWVDNLNGPVGIFVGGSKGIIRSMLCEGSYKADVISVDIVVNACILIAYVTALDKPKETQVYNVTLSGAIKISWYQVITLGEKWVHEYPYTLALWYPGGSLKSSRIMHKISVAVTHYLPAYLIDGLLYILGKKTFMVKVQKKVSRGLEVLEYYTMKEWNFKNTNFLALRHRVDKSDEKTFFIDASECNVDEYLRNCVLGAREYCLKEDSSTLPRARTLHKIRYVADRIMKFISLCLLFWFLYCYRDVSLSALELLDCYLKNFTFNPIKAKESCESN